MLLPLLAGCGAETSVSGTVTYDGVPLENGFITFFPAEGEGPTQGAEIHEGQYRLARPVPGKKRILVADRPHVQLVPAEIGKSRVRLVRPVNAIPAGAVGNNRVVEVAAGNQTLDFHLKRPAR